MNILSLHANLSIEEMQTHSSYLINALDKEHKIIFWNNKCEEYFQVKKEVALGKKFEELFPEFSNDERMIHIDRALAGQQMVRLDQYSFTKKYYRQRLIPVREKNGEVIAVLNMVQDV